MITVLAQSVGMLTPEDGHAIAQAFTVFGAIAALAGMTWVLRINNRNDSEDLVVAKKINDAEDKRLLRQTLMDLLEASRPAQDKLNGTDGQRLRAAAAAASAALIGH